MRGSERGFLVVTQVDTLIPATTASVYNTEHGAPAARLTARHAARTELKQFHDNNNNKPNADLPGLPPAQSPRG